MRIRSAVSVFIFSLLSLLLTVQLSSAQLVGVVVECTVGVNQTYSTIQSALLGCNAGVGNISLLIDNGTYSEPAVYFPWTLASVEMRPLSVNLSDVPAAPEPFQDGLAIHWQTRELWVQNDTASIYFYGIWFDGLSTHRPLFYPRLRNQNATFDHCLFSDYHSNNTILMEGYDQVSILRVRNSRFLRNWGSAINGTGLSDYEIRNDTFARCGGYNNHSCTHLHLHDRASGDAVIVDNVHYLVADTQQSAACNSNYDPDGMVVCRNGVPYCYSVSDTATTENCPLVDLTVWNITSQSFVNVTDYDPACRVYVPCTCSTIEMLNQTTGISEFFPMGDIFFYTGLVLPCFVLDNATLVDTTNYTFVGSRAGDLTQPAGDVGIAPLAGYDGWSNQVLALDSFYIVAIPFNRTVSPYPPPGNVFLTLLDSNGTVVFNHSNPGLTNVAASNLTQDNITLLLEGSCYCDSRVKLLNETVECNYNISYDETSLAFYNFTIPNLVDPANQTLFCMNGSMLCCADENCTYYVSCLCPAQIDYTDGTAFNQSELYNTSMIGDWLTQVNSSAAQYQLLASFNFTVLNTSIVNYLGLVQDNDTANFSSVISAYYATASPDIYCLVNGSCALPLVGNIYVAFDVRCNHTMPFYNQSAIEEWQALVVDTWLNNTGYNVSSNITVDDWLVSTGFNWSDPIVPPPAPYYPPQGVLQCPCDEDSLLRGLVPYQVGNYTAGFDVDFIPGTVRNLQLTNNRANQLPYGWWVDRVTNDLIISRSQNDPYFFDAQSTIREIARQGNSLINGTRHQFAYGSREVELSQIYCDNLCPLQYPTIESMASLNPCIVDNSAGDATGNAGGGGGGGVNVTVNGHTISYRVYFAVQDAIDAGCTALILEATENFYAEDLTIKSQVRQIYSFDNPGAIVLGTHMLETDTIEMRGVQFRHSGDKSVPLFSKKQTMKNVTILNCRLDGNGVRGGGIFSRQDTHGFDYLCINSSVVINWVYLGMEVYQVMEFDMHYNYMERIHGRAFDVEFERRIGISSNYFNDVRGIKGQKGVNVFAFRVRKDVKTACLPSSGAPCYLFNNMQNVDITSEDYQDTFFLLQRGYWNPPYIFGNKVIKANTGFRFRDVPYINTTSLVGLVLQNSMNRPSNFPQSAVLNRIALNTALQGVSNKVAKKITKLTRGIRDYRLDVYYQSSLGSYQKVLSNFGCNYPCAELFGVNATRQLSCEVNQNYENMHSTMYGFQSFRNYSDAHYFCRATDQTNQIGIIIPINGTGWGGGRIINDNITSLFPVHMQGIVLPWELDDEWEQPRPEAYPRSVVYGTGHTIIGDPFIAERLEYRLAFRQYRVNMWSTQPDEFAITNITFRQVTFDGRNLEPYSATTLLALFSGIDPDRALSEADPEDEKGGVDIKPQKCVPQSVVVDGCLFRNTYEYLPQRMIPDRDPVNPINISSTAAPYTDMLLVKFLQTKGCTKTVVNITNNVFRGNDRRPLDVSGALVSEITNNSFIDCGGRSLDNTAVVLVSGNPFEAHGFLNFSFNVQNQTREVLFPYTSQARQAMLAAYTIKGYADDAMLCIHNNTFANMTIGMRYYALTLGNATNPGPLVSCVDPTNKPKYYDTPDELRRLFYEGNNGTSIVCDQVYGAPYQDFERIFICCNSSCIPPDPVECSVSMTNISYVPSHPWWNRYFFNDPVLALEKCNASSYRIRLDPNTPLQSYNTVIDPIYPFNSTVYNSTLFVVPTLICQGPLGTTAPTTGPHAVITGCGHRLRRGRLAIQGCIFNSTCVASSQATWMQIPDPPLPGDPALLLELYGNTFQGNGAVAQAFDGLANDSLRIESNTFVNYTGLDVTRVHGLPSNGTFCDSDKQVYVNRNTWLDPPGTALSIFDVGGYEADWNNFKSCGCTNTTRNACAYFTICRNVSRNTTQFIHSRENRISGPSTHLAQPSAAGEFCTGLYYDFVPDQTITVDIAGNRGTYPGTCFRLVDLPNAFPIQDPKQRLRYYAQNKRNQFCKRGPAPSGYDIEQAAPNFTDTLIRNNENRYPGRFCNDGCGEINGATVAIILSIIFGLVLLAVIAAIYTRQRSIGPRTTFSNTLQREVPIEFDVYGRAYGVNPRALIARKLRTEKYEEEAKTRHEEDGGGGAGYIPMQPIGDGSGHFIGY